MTEKLKNLVNKLTLDYIITKDETIFSRAEKECIKQFSNEQEFIEREHEYGAILYYRLFEGVLKKKDRKYFNYMKKEIEEKGENAEIDIDYLEKIIPAMRSLNFIVGIYNKQYGPDEKEVFEFRAAVRTGRSKPNEVREEIIITPYNLRMKNKINAAASK